MKGYERNHTCLPSGREVTERKLILCVTDTSCSPNNELCNFTGIERELKRIRYFYKNESLPISSNPCFNL